MKHEIDFNYDGTWASDMGVIKFNHENDLFGETVSNKYIIQEKIEGRKRPYFYGVDYEPIQFELFIYFENNLTVKKVGEILRWLNQDVYKPFFMSDNRERVLYVQAIDDIQLIHNGIENGYLSLTMQADSPQHLTPFTTSKVYKIDNSKVIEFENSGDFNNKPIVHIVKRGSGNITIRNMSNDNGEFKFTGLKDKEYVTVDCEHNEIKSSENSFRYDNFSKNYLEFSRGFNTLRITGNCDLWFETEFEIY